MSGEHPPADDRIHALLDGDHIFSARQSGLYRQASPDATPENLFRVWQPDQTLPAMALARIENQLLAGINGGVALSQDGGASWQALQFRSPPPLTTCLALSPNFKNDGIALAGAFEDGVFRSDDGGKTWAAFNFGLFDHNIYCIALSPCFNDDGLAFVGAGSGVYRSQNGGRFWRDMTLPAGDETVLCLALSPTFDADRIVYAGSESHGILRSDDGGDSWRSFSQFDGAVNAILCLPGGGLAALVNDALLRSDDGTNWRVQVTADVQALAISADGLALLLGLADGKIQRVPIAN